MNPSALIGFSGLVGSTLLRQAHFASLYRSTNIGTIAGQSFETVVCAGAPAQKWIANREPETDREKIDGLMAHLKTIHCKTFILISTVDVFDDPVGTNEDAPIDKDGLHPYGLHRRLLEEFVETRFPERLVVRLPGLVGPGLRKNVIFDLLNDNRLDAIDSRGVFQFYPLVNLWWDIQVARQAGLKLVHLTAEPIGVAEVAKAGFGQDFSRTLAAPPAVYDFQSNHASLFGGQGRYQYNRRETIQAIRAYAQTEPRTIKPGQGAG